MSQVTTAQISSYGVYLLVQWDKHGYWLKLLVLCLPLLTVHCAALQPRDEAALPLADVLPASWVALRDVQEVNIDGDGATEYLLFFTYDPNPVTAPATSFFFSRSSEPSGPIGAVIYDAQVVTGTATTERVSPDRPTNALVPYAILPSYRRGAGQGFIAEPAQGATVAAYPLSYRTLTPTGGTTASTAADTLVFLGGETYLTFAWWQNRAEGYGVTQIYGPGGFEETLYNSFDWTQWRDNPQPIQQIIAVHPLHDRNLLCRRFRYEFNPTAGGSADRPMAGRPILYQKIDLGLQFCAGTPEHPFYPEGVVLAYLLEGNDALLDATVVTDTVAASAGGLPWLRQLVQQEDTLRVDDLASYATLVTTTAPSAAGPPDTIVVCATLTLQPAATAGTGESAPNQQTLLFTLRHQPAGFQPPTSDRLFIQNVETIAAPIGGGVVNCQAQLGG